MSGWVGGPVELCWIGRVAIWSLVLCQSFVPYCFHLPISSLNLELSNFLPSDCFPTQRRDQEVINLCQFIHVLAVVLYLYIIPLYMVQFRALKSTVAISLKSVWPEFIDCELAVLALAQPKWQGFTYVVLRHYQLNLPHCYQNITIPKRKALLDCQFHLLCVWVHYLFRIASNFLPTDLLYSKLTKQRITGLIPRSLGLICVRAPIKLGFNSQSHSKLPVWISGFLRYLDEERFPDGQRQLLSEEQLGMAFWLLTGFPPALKVKDLRASTRGELCPSCNHCKHQSSLKNMWIDELAIWGFE